MDDLKEHIQSQLGDAINGAEIAFGELTLEARRAEVLTVLTFLRDDPICKFTQLIDIAGVDYPSRARRFDVVYHLLSMSQNTRVRVKITTDEEVPVLSCAAVFPNADWYEREAFDMFQELLEKIKDEVIMFLLRIQVSEPEEIMEAMEPAEVQEGVEYSHPSADSAFEDDATADVMQGADAEQPYKREAAKVGRNDPCPCGSGKKYKQCHGKLS